jgi:aspartate carbamoyltransferase catalytic subunit
MSATINMKIVVYSNKHTRERSARKEERRERESVVLCTYNFHSAKKHNKILNPLPVDAQLSVCKNVQGGKRENFLLIREQKVCICEEDMGLVVKWLIIIERE